MIGVERIRNCKHHTAETRLRVLVERIAAWGLKGRQDSFGRIACDSEILRRKFRLPEPRRFRYGPKHCR
jgi:hypothetical protein